MSKCSELCCSMVAAQQQSTPATATRPPPPHKHPNDKMLEVRRSIALYCSESRCPRGSPCMPLVINEVQLRCSQVHCSNCREHSLVKGLVLAGRAVCHDMRTAHMCGSLRGASLNSTDGLQAHGVLMAVSFVAIIPISVIISSTRHRFLGSSWLQIHRALGVRQLHLSDLLVQQPWEGWVQAGSSQKTS